MPGTASGARECVVNVYVAPLHRQGAATVEFTDSKFSTLISLPWLDELLLDLSLC